MLVRTARLLRVLAAALLALVALLPSYAARAMAPEVVRELAFGDNGAKIKALGTLVAAVSPLPEARAEVVIDNRVRREIAAAIAAPKLAFPDRGIANKFLEA